MLKAPKIKRFFRYIYLKLIRLNDSPEKIALSFSIGVFIGVFPTFGLGGILVVIISYIFKLNYLAGVLGTFIMNYITSPFFWSLSYFIGNFLLYGKFEWKIWEERNIKEFALSYIVGNIIVSILCFFLSYFIVRKLVITYRKRRGRRKAPSS
ncbi:MAG TPA: DUF2062 domain-containing protein [Dictyoglomaceae bacterium]|nr:DUF2062 domain-containing protein [Dictyoglomaceae bacterium]HOL39617.1 DUF2062 domain-containing protein [Dictyoglomaceae bacterium]HOP95161.1 DUF2062 domain-containing protein [Dictyoglomaceae bacterium]HPP15189.1 DUF2062 domain-containing protein [Dictyoglomaceae bacterium]HPU42595.1 DUF2062 domain-containing protein [Dictyoglomaceae bacterium]